MVCLRNISVDTLHKGDTDDDDDNNHNNNNSSNNNNNNNNKTANKISLPPSQFVIRLYLPLTEGR
jgi:hypothetical protein